MQALFYGATVAQLVGQSSMNPKVSGLLPSPPVSWSHVQVSLNKTLNPDICRLKRAACPKQVPYVVIKVSIVMIIILDVSLAVKASSDPFLQVKEPLPNLYTVPSAITVLISD